VFGVTIMAARISDPWLSWSRQKVTLTCDERYSRQRR